MVVEEFEWEPERTDPTRSTLTMRSMLLGLGEAYRSGLRSLEEVDDLVCRLLLRFS